MALLRECLRQVRERHGDGTPPLHARDLQSPRPGAQGVTSSARPVADRMSLRDRMPPRHSSMALFTPR
jgi:hypothetical protein